MEPYINSLNALTFTTEARWPGKKAGRARPVRKAAFFCLDFSLLLSFDQAKESKNQGETVGRISFL